jgi:hypothetical protein
MDAADILGGDGELAEPPRAFLRERPQQDELALRFVQPEELEEFERRHFVNSRKRRRKLSSEALEDQGSMMYIR